MVSKSIFLSDEQAVESTWLNAIPKKRTNCSFIDYIWNAYYVCDILEQVLKKFYVGSAVYETQERITSVSTLIGCGQFKPFLV